MSARKPSRPRFTPSTGTACGEASRAACSIVPSPPIATTRFASAASFAAGPTLDAGRAEVHGAVALGENLAPAGMQVHGEDLHRLDDARVAIVADQGDAREH